MVDYQEYIEINPGVLSGKPVIKGTRISVELIMKLYRKESGSPHHEPKESDVFPLFLRNNGENHFLLGIIAQRWTDEEIITEYPSLSGQDIQAALIYAEKLVESEEVYPILAS